MAKKNKTKSQSLSGKITETATKLSDIVIEEDESDILLSGVDHDSEDLREEVKKEAAKSNMISRFLVPLFTFLSVFLVSAAVTWYFAKPEREPEIKMEEKIQTPPVIKEESEKTITEAPKIEVTEKKEEAYTVKEGDTLSSIANAYGMTSQELAAYNNITDPNNLRIGQVIKIPLK